MPPSSYVTRYEDVCERLEHLQRGTVREIGRSAGGRPLHAVSYGEFEPVARTANLSSALAAGEPAAYYGSGGSRQVLVAVAAVHGAEMESIAAVMHLLCVLETGLDLDGVEWPELYAAAGALRLVLVPVGNPDGRARITADDPLTWTASEAEQYRHGLAADGHPNGWMPGCFVPHPRPAGFDSFLGGYFNDAGVNPSHGAFLDRTTSPESHALINLVEAETPDAYLDLHSCGSGPFLFSGSRFIPEELAARQSFVDGAWRQKMRDRGLPAPTWTTRSRRQVMGLDEVMYHRTGLLPLVFEGGSGERYSGIHIHRQIVESYLLLFETVCGIATTEGLRG